MKLSVRLLVAVTLLALSRKLLTLKLVIYPFIDHFSHLCSFINLQISAMLSGPDDRKKRKNSVAHFAPKNAVVERLTVEMNVSVNVSTRKMIVVRINPNKSCVIFTHIFFSFSPQTLVALKADESIPDYKA